MVLNTHGNTSGGTYMARLQRFFAILVVAVCCFASSAGAAGGERLDVTAARGVVTSASPLASRIGVDVLKKGGNAFDAAVATAFAISIAEPGLSSIGGGGFALLYNAKEKKTYAIDFRDKAPAKAHEHFYEFNEKGRIKNNAKATGWYSVAVPGNVAAMEAIHTRFGSKKWSDLVLPAARLLEQGVPVNSTLYEFLLNALGRIERSPSKDFFYKTFFKDDLPLAIGEKYYAPDLVKTLNTIAAEGGRALYTGSIADKITAAFATHADGWITKQDLADYTVALREPVRGTYRGRYAVVSVPPPAGGLSVIEILHILENFDLKKMGYGTPDTVHTMVEAQKLAFADKSKYMADPDFKAVPVATLVDKKYAASRAALIQMDSALKSPKAGDVDALAGNTTSFSVIDKAGNMVTITQTINHFMGALVVPEGTGILMNNQMNAFADRPGRANSVQAGKRPLSNMAPTLVLKDGKPLLTLGSPGSTRIITAVSTILVNVIDYGMNLQDAIAAPRFHNSNLPKTYLEARWSPEFRKALEDKGHTLEIYKEMDVFFGGAQGAMILPNGKIRGCADPRRSGKAVGY